MLLVSKELNLPYIYDANRSGAKYSLNGQNWMNGGEFAEIATKHMFGYTATKDANTAYDKGSDIEEMNASVKSSKATLVNMKLADTFEESINVYFQNTHSTLFIYTVIIDNVVTAYMMNANEFRTFIENWAGLNERGFVRFKATSGKMIKWLESL